MLFRYGTKYTQSRGPNKFLQVHLFPAERRRVILRKRWVAYRQKQGQVGLPIHLGP